ncbi:DUF2993 domain-containing protein [Microbacterium sp. LRZ72]|uniref:LmeA family phospholipid-binding protein n=1 Tax=Microbacterium sp. LRZ72 TaxID=2942481 RepID=UPI0029B22876|nr:DUF2993 domain-containing protein [Microbacterium sp. LRZ72]MDX2377343.1 DUF2993 domain-containing protein [Microbacterium sp. LRZ72]
MSGSEHPTQPLPDPAQQWVLGTPEPQRRRRRAWPWILAAAVAAVVLVTAWFVAELLARDLVERGIRTQVVDQLGVATADQVAVEVSGAVLPQLIGGTLDEVSIVAQDATLDSLTADIEIHAQGVPVRGDADLDEARARVTLDEQQLRDLLTTIEDFPADTVAVQDGEVTMTVELSFFGATVPIGVGLEPSAADGQLLLAPSSLRLAGATISADDLRAQFGGFADAVLRSWPVCIAEDLPAGVTVSSVAVDAEGDTVVDLDIAPGILHDEALLEPGTCS